MYATFFKRLFDLVFSLVAFTVFAPFMLVIAIVLTIINKGTPFFIHERPGYRGEPFQLVKFKSMTDERDEQGQLLPDNERITPFGRFLRKTSLDELPQLYNVIVGDMSLVGPRPLLFKYIPLYSEEQRRRLEVRPGITGWAQVNGRNSISWTKKFEYDVYYVDHVSFVLDLKILGLTVLKVLKREGVNQSAERPMQPFNGYN